MRSKISCLALRRLAIISYGLSWLLYMWQHASRRRLGMQELGEEWFGVMHASLADTTAHVPTTYVSFYLESLKYVFLADTAAHIPGGFVLFYIYSSPWLCCLFSGVSATTFSIWRSLRRSLFNPFSLLWYLRCPLLPTSTSFAAA